MKKKIIRSQVNNYRNKNRTKKHETYRHKKITKNTTIKKKKRKKITTKKQKNKE